MTHHLLVSTLGVEMTDHILNIFVQFGIGGLVLWVGYAIAMKLIDKWALGDAARTKVVEEGFKAITNSHERVLDRIDSHHILMMQQVHMLAIGVNRLDAKVSHHFDLTPPPQTIPPPMLTQQTVMVDPSLLEDNDPTPVDRPSAQKVKTPVKGVPTGLYGLSNKPPRPKTNG